MSAVWTGRIYLRHTRVRPSPELSCLFCFLSLCLFLITLVFPAGDSGWTSCGRAAIWCWVFQEVPQSEYCSVSKNVRKGKSLFLCSLFMTWVWARASVAGSRCVSYSHHFTVLWISVCALTSVWRKIWIPSIFWEYFKVYMFEIWSPAQCKGFWGFIMWEILLQRIKLSIVSSVS